MAAKISCVCVRDYAKQSFCTCQFTVQEPNEQPENVTETIIKCWIKRKAFGFRCWCVWSFSSSCCCSATGASHFRENITLSEFYQTGLYNMRSFNTEHTWKQRNIYMSASSCYIFHIRFGYYCFYRPYAMQNLRSHEAYEIKRISCKCNNISHFEIYSNALPPPSPKFWTSNEIILHYQYWKWKNKFALKIEYLVINSMDFTFFAKSV